MCSFLRSNHLSVWTPWFFKSLLSVDLVYRPLVGGDVISLHTLWQSFRVYLCYVARTRTLGRKFAFSTLFFQAGNKCFVFLLGRCVEALAVCAPNCLDRVQCSALGCLALPHIKYFWLSFRLSTLQPLYSTTPDEDFAYGLLFITLRQGAFSRTSVEEIRCEGQGFRSAH